MGSGLRLGGDRNPEEPADWTSGAWTFRPERMYLVPGDSPMGYRLPLDSFPWVSKEDFPTLYEMDPWAERKPLPAYAKIGRQSYITGSPEAHEPLGQIAQIMDPEGAPGTRTAPSPIPEFGPGTGAGPRSKLGPGDGANEADLADWEARRRRASGLPPAKGEPAPWLVRTALCVELRGSALRVFMPPLRYLEDYLELVAAIEDTAADTKFPLLGEGYTRPHHHRVNQ